MIAPTIEALASQYSRRVVFGKLNVDENPSTAIRYGIMSIPTLLFFKNGSLVDSIIGAVPRSYIEQKLCELT
jgi:thioredoxin 1